MQALVSGSMACFPSSQGAVPLTINTGTRVQEQLRQWLRSHRKQKKKMSMPSPLCKQSLCPLLGEWSMDRSRDSYRFKSRLSVLGSASAYRLAANRLLVTQTVEESWKSMSCACVWLTGDNDQLSNSTSRHRFLFWGARRLLSVGFQSKRWLVRMKMHCLDVEQVQTSGPRVT